MKITVFNPTKGLLQEKSLIPSTDKPSLFLIGRHPNCDLILDTPEVSRVHGLINYFQQNYYFTELASTHGSRINNQEIYVNKSQILINGDIIQIIDFYLLFLAESEEIEKSNPYWFLKPQTTVNSTQATAVKQNELIVQALDNTPKHFHSAAFNQVSTSHQSNKVMFTKSQQEVICDDGETILEAAQREGITLPFGCQMGACGRCKLRKISGEVSYEKDFDCEDGYVLTCVAKAVGNVVIEG